MKEATKAIERAIAKWLEKEFPGFWQAGMGAGVSRRWMAKIVAMFGGLGIVSSAVLRNLIIAEIKRSDADAIRMAREFPIPQYVDEILSYAPGGSRHHLDPPKSQGFGECGLAERLTAIATFIEVRLAKEGHSGKIGINIMWKITFDVLPTIYGALLAGIDAIIGGAGVPMELLEIVEKLRRGEDLYYSPLYSTTSTVGFKQDGMSEYLSQFDLPMLVPIFSNYTFSKKIVDVWTKKHGRKPDFIVLEDYNAGGHNAPARNKICHTPEVDGVEAYFDQCLTLGVPLIVAGAYPPGVSSSDLLGYWTDRGAYGIQVGSPFALCEETGMRSDLRDRIIAGNRAGTTKIVTSLQYSPTKFPLKGVIMEGTLTDPEVYNARVRECRYGYLRQEFEGALVCPAMPLEQYMRLCPSKSKEQCESDCEGRICLCEGLPSTVGVLDCPPVITLGLSGLDVTSLCNIREIMEDMISPQYVAEQEQLFKVA